MRVRVTTTKYAIKHGDRGDCFACPVARALKRLVLPSVEVRVSQRHILLGFDGEAVTSIALPRSIVKWVELYDCESSYFASGGCTLHDRCSRRMQPISFCVNIPKEFLRPSVRSRKS